MSFILDIFKGWLDGVKLSRQRKLKEINDWEEEGQIGLIIAVRESKIMEGVPKDEAWAEYFERLEEIRPFTFEVRK